MTICPLGTVNFVSFRFHKRQNNVSFELDLQGINWLTAEKTEGTAEGRGDYPASSMYSLCPLQLKAGLQYFTVEQVVLGCLIHPNKAHVKIDKIGHH